jgi:hypothetical protein
LRRRKIAEAMPAGPAPMIATLSDVASSGAVIVAPM